MDKQKTKYDFKFRRNYNWNLDGDMLTRLWRVSVSFDNYFM